MRFYLVFLVLIATIAVPLLFPLVIVYVAVATFGLGLFPAIGVVNLFAILVLLIPAVWLGQRSKLVGIIAAVTIVAGAVFGPAAMREMMRGGVPYFAPQIALAGPPVQPIRSVEFDALVQQRKLDYTCSTICLRVMQNETIEFVRLRFLDGTTRLFERTDLGMVDVDDTGRAADISITDYDRGARDERNLPPFWSLQSRLDGYVITDNQTGTVVARNVGAVLFGANNITSLTIGNILQGSSTWTLTSRREETTSQLDLTLEAELAGLGIRVGPETEGMTPNTPERVARSIQKILDRTEQSDRDNPDYTEQEQDIVDEFRLQVRRDIEVESRLPQILALFDDPRANFGQFSRKLESNNAAVDHIARRLVEVFGRPEFVDLTKRLNNTEPFINAMAPHSARLVQLYFAGDADMKRTMLRRIRKIDLPIREALLNSALDDALSSSENNITPKPEEEVDAVAILDSPFSGRRRNSPVPQSVLILETAMVTMGELDDLDPRFVRQWLQRWLAAPDLFHISMPTTESIAVAIAQTYGHSDLTIQIKSDDRLATPVTDF